MGYATPADVKVKYYHHHQFNESEAGRVADAVRAVWDKKEGKDEL